MSFLNDKRVGDLLKEIRLSLGKNTPRSFAIEASIDESQYAKLEKGELTLSLKVLEKLKTKYGEVTYNAFNGIEYGIYLPNFVHENTRPEPGVKELVEVLEKQNEILRKGFNLDDGPGKSSEDPALPDQASPSVGSGLKQDISRTYKKEKKPQTGNDSEGSK